MQYTWSKDGDIFAVGPAIDALLPEGEYLITLKVEDSSGDNSEATIAVKVTPLCEGDLDNNLIVNETDLADFAADFGRIDCAADPSCRGDIFIDGVVDGRDLVFFITDFARTDCPQPD